MTTLNQIREELFIYRGKTGATQADVAKMAGLSCYTLSRFEAGVNIKTVTAYKLLAAIREKEEEIRNAE